MFTPSKTRGTGVKEAVFTPSMTRGKAVKGLKNNICENTHKYGIISLQLTLLLKFNDLTF